MNKNIYYAVETWNGNYFVLYNMEFAFFLTRDGWFIDGENPLYSAPFFNEALRKCYRKTELLTSDTSKDSIFLFAEIAVANILRIKKAKELQKQS